jgi:hypothetical protein
VTASVEAVAAEHDHEIFDHVLRAGTTAGQRWNWTGRRDGAALVEIETLWTVGNEYPKHWPKPQHGWTLTIEGDPSMRAHFFSLASFERDASMLEHVNSANVATGCKCSTRCPRYAQPPPASRPPGWAGAQSDRLRQLEQAEEHLFPGKPRFESLLDRGQESGGVGAVHDSVVVGQREVDHRAHRDGETALGVTARGTPARRPLRCRGWRTGVR